MNSMNPLDLRGEDVIAARKKLGWTRQDLATRSGLQYHEVTSVERQLRRVREHEVQAITKALGMQLEEAHEEANVQAAGTEHMLNPRNAVRSTEWRGLSKGENCRVKGLHGVFHFMYHHVDDAQEYVQVYGPVSGRNPLSMLRSVRVDRLRDYRGRKLQ